MLETGVVTYPTPQVFRVFKAIIEKTSVDADARWQEQIERDVLSWRRKFGRFLLGQALRTLIHRAMNFFNQACDAVNASLSEVPLDVRTVQGEIDDINNLWTMMTPTLSEQEVIIGQSRLSQLHTLFQTSVEIAPEDDNDQDQLLIVIRLLTRLNNMLLAECESAKRTCNTMNDTCIKLMDVIKEQNRDDMRLKTGSSLTHNLACLAFFLLGCFAIQSSHNKIPFAGQFNQDIDVHKSEFLS